jgi:hypothetical protein
MKVNRCMKTQGRAWLSGLLILVAAGSPAVAGELTNLEPDLPTSIEDAYPIAYLGSEVQLIQQVQRVRDNRDAKRTEARFELGFPRNGQVRIGVPFLWGRNEENGVTSINGDFMYNFNQETLWLPAFTLDAGAWLPIGHETRGYDPFIKGIVTKTISVRSGTLQQVHASILWRNNDRATPEEENYETQLVVGYSRLITPSLLAVADFANQWGMQQSSQSRVVELGLRYQLTPMTTLSGGAGFGIGDDSPQWLVTFGIQLSP